MMNHALTFGGLLCLRHSQSAEPPSNEAAADLDNLFAQNAASPSAMFISSSMIGSERSIDKLRKLAEFFLVLHPKDGFRPSTVFQGKRNPLGRERTSILMEHSILKNILQSRKQRKRTKRSKLEPVGKQVSKQEPGRRTANSKPKGGTAVVRMNSTIDTARAKLASGDQAIQHEASSRSLEEAADVAVIPSKPFTKEELEQLLHGSQYGQSPTAYDVPETDADISEGAYDVPEIDPGNTPLPQA